MAAKRQAALMIAPEVPYPVAGGGALRTASLLHYLAQTRDVDLIVFRQPGAPDPALHLPQGLVRRLTVLDLPFHRKSGLPRAVRNTVRLVRSTPPLVDRFAGFESAIANAVEGRSYSVGLVEHFWCAPYLPQIAPVCKRTVLDLHNIESALHAGCANSETAVSAFAHRIFARAASRLEARWLPLYSDVLTASVADVLRARALAPKANVYVYPNAIPQAPRPSTVPDHAIVFSGNMEYHPNRAAVRFFVSSIWPLLRQQNPGLICRLVGKHPESVHEFTAGVPGIEATGEIPDAVAEIARAKVAVVPLLAGSGTRLKILEAWAAGVPVVSTKIGAEGLPVRDGHHLLLADSAPEFAAAVTRLLACSELRERIAAAARVLLEEEFTWEKVWGLLTF